MDYFNSNFLLSAQFNLDKKFIKETLLNAYRTLNEKIDKYSEVKALGLYIIHPDNEFDKNFSLIEVFRFIKEEDKFKEMIDDLLDSYVVNTDMMTMLSFNSDFKHKIDGFDYMFYNFLKLTKEEQSETSICVCTIKDFNKLLMLSERIFTGLSSPSINLLSVFANYNKYGTKSKAESNLKNINARHLDKTNSFVGVNFEIMTENWGQLIDCQLLFKYYSEETIADINAKKAKFSEETIRDENIKKYKHYVPVNIKKGNAILKLPRYLAESFIYNVERRYMKYDIISASRLTSYIWWSWELDIVLKREIDKAKLDSRIKDVHPSVIDYAAEQYKQKLYPFLRIDEK